MKEPNRFAIPPWKQPEEWSQVVVSIEQTVANQNAKLDRAREIAGQIEKLYKKINDGFDAVCGVTCVSCMDVCCKKATVWYDFKDLLFIYLMQGKLPESQISKQPDLSCTNLTSSGCAIRRIERPFICTWYICPPQSAVLKEEAFAEVSKIIQASKDDMKILRNHLEESFLKAVSSA